jgi:hypothetical protein
MALWTSGGLGHLLSQTRPKASVPENENSPARNAPNLRTTLTLNTGTVAANTRGMLTLSYMVKGTWLTQDEVESAEARAGKRIAGLKSTWQ